ncbi:MAG: hypothetical protein KKB70_02335 [Proteobacteria bacterium]|nr:hypothetical protein [Pseudomonadota bacterium]
MIPFKSFLVMFIVLCCLTPSLSQAEPPAPTKTVHKKKTTPVDDGIPRNINEVTYQEWLKNYQAWDKLDKVYSSSEHTPENVIKQARAAMNAGNPERVLEIVESTVPFEDSNATEIDRLWLGGQAYRALGVPERAVLWFVEAADLMSPAERKSKLTSEPDMDLMWKDVFRKLFEIYIYNSSITHEAQAVYLQRILNHASPVWSSDNYWEVATSVFEQSLPQEPEEPGTTHHGKIQYVSNDDMLAGASVFAISSIKQEIPEKFFIDVSDRNLAGFWKRLLVLIEKNDKSLGDDAEMSGQAVRATRFLAGDFGLISEYLGKNWTYEPASSAFESFSQNTRLLSIDELYLLFLEGNPASLMVETVPESELLPLQLGLGIAKNNREMAEYAKENLDITALPHGLKLAVALYFDLQFKDVFKREPDMTNKEDLFWNILLEAAGAPPAFPHLAPFWQVVDPTKDRTTLIRQWPLDPEVMLEVWKYDWLHSRDSSLARRIAYLYPTEQLGMLCMLYLADEALHNNQVKLSDFYVSKVDTSATNSTISAEYYRVQAEILISKEDMDGAYASYQKLVESGAPIDDTTRLKIAFLLQQRGELSQGREHLLRLWERKDEFDTPMQAEILFYLAEGEQAMGLSDKALDYYLQLAWKYPQESMWALTAMYRAATIYEDREQYDPAEKLLNTVLKNAATPKQREAATTKLENIRGRRAKDTSHGSGAVPYPF